MDGYARAGWACVVVFSGYSNRDGVGLGHPIGLAPAKKLGFEPGDLTLGRRQTNNMVFGKTFLALLGSVPGAAVPPNRSVSIWTSSPAAALSTISETIDGTLEYELRLRRNISLTDLPPGHPNVFCLDEAVK